MLQQLDTNNKKRKNELKCLSIGEIWDKAKYLAKKEGRTVSAYIRETIKKQYKKERRKEVASVS